MKKYLVLFIFLSVSLGLVFLVLSSGNRFSWSGNKSSTPTFYEPAVKSYFNVSWNVSSGYYIDKVLIEGNWSGSAQNYSMSLVSGDDTNGTWTYNNTLTAGTYYWKSYANCTVACGECPNTRSECVLEDGVPKTIEGVSNQEWFKFSCETSAKLNITVNSGNWSFCCVGTDNTCSDQTFDECPALTDYCGEDVLDFSELSAGDDYWILVNGTSGAYTIKVDCIA